MARKPKFSGDIVHYFEAYGGTELELAPGTVTALKDDGRVSPIRARTHPGLVRPVFPNLACLQHPVAEGRSGRGRDLLWRPCC
jgi:hypothetical protein